MILIIPQFFRFCVNERNDMKIPAGAPYSPSAPPLLFHIVAHEHKKAREPLRCNGSRSSSLSKKTFRQAAASFSNFKKFEKLMIENERHPSWVSFVTIFLPVAQDFRVYRQSERTRRNGASFPISYRCYCWDSLLRSRRAASSFSSVPA